MLIATWNLDHRIGKTRFRAEAVNAVAALQADVVVLTEYYPRYYPRDYESAFRADVSNAGWHLLASEIVGEIANRVLIASRFPLEPFPLPFPDFDRQFPPNILCVTIPAAGIRVLGIRIPAYIGEDKLTFRVHGTGWNPPCPDCMTHRPSLPRISTSTWIRGEQKAATTSVEFSPTAGTAPLPKGKEATSAQTGDVPRSITFSATAVSVLPTHATLRKLVGFN